MDILVLLLCLCLSPIDLAHGYSDVHFHVEQSPPLVAAVAGILCREWRLGLSGILLDCFSLRYLLVPVVLCFGPFLGFFFHLPFLPHVSFFTQPSPSFLVSDLFPKLPSWIWFWSSWTYSSSSPLSWGCSRTCAKDSWSVSQFNCSGCVGAPHPFLGSISIPVWASWPRWRDWVRCVWWFVFLFFKNFVFAATFYDISSFPFLLSFVTLCAFFFLSVWTFFTGIPILLMFTAANGCHKVN